MKREKKKLMTVELDRCYFKFGDDFAHYLETTKNVPDALIALAENLTSGAANYRRIASILAGVPDVKGFGQTHLTCVTVPTDKAEELIKEGLVQKQDFGE